MRVVLPVIIAALLSASPALAGEAPKPASDQTVKLSPVALPIVTDGRVVNYVFVNIRILLSPSADAAALRDKEPFFRDRLVRAAYRTPFMVAGSLNKIDEGKLKATLTHEAADVAGPGKVIGVAIDSQTPQHYLPPPAPPPAAPQRDDP